MENKRLKLPTGIPTFEKIRTGGYVYVDKTQYLINLIDTCEISFLARPRRFGKSLTVSTFEALFSGRKDLFKGLYAEEFLNRPDFKPSPVISLDMSSIDTDSGINGIKQSLKQVLLETADNLEIDVPTNISAGDIFRNIIIQTSKKHNQRVVILIDEYDAPYTDFVNDAVTANKVRGVLRNFYKQMKANDSYIRFIFLTGISKFARFGVFSTLNHTTDISLKPEYAGICGYTEEEIIRYFPDYLEDTAKKMGISIQALIEKMRYYYNGFCFDDEVQTKLYNPFSTLSFFDRKKFLNYWIHTGNSKVIADYMKNHHFTVEQFRHFPIPEDFAENPGDVDTTPPEGFLYQCGYLTLSEMQSGNFFLDYPNTEVLNAMSRLFIQNTVTEKDYNLIHSELTTAVTSNNVDNFVTVVNRLLAKIPYEDYSIEKMLSRKNYLILLEKICRSSILSFLHGCGLHVMGEMHTNKGRSDLVFSHVENPIVWVVEIKIASKRQSAKRRALEALRQITDNNYAAPFTDALCVGIAIHEEKRQITEFTTQKLNVP